MCHLHMRKKKNEMTYLKEANEKLTHELVKWEQRWADMKKKLALRDEEEEDAP